MKCDRWTFLRHSLSGMALTGLGGVEFLSAAAAKPKVFSSLLLQPNRHLSALAVVPRVVRNGQQVKSADLAL